MKRNLVFFFICVLFSFGLSAQDNITVAVTSSESGTGLTVIQYILTGSAAGYNLSVEVSFDNGNTYAPIPAAHLTGGLTSVAPGSHTLTWDGKASFPDTFSETARVRITAEPDNLNIIRGGPPSTSPLAIPIQITGVDAGPYNSDLEQWIGNWHAPQAIYDQGDFVNDPENWRDIENNNNAGSTWYNTYPGDSYGILVVDLQQDRQISNVSVFQMFSDGKTTHIALAGHAETGGTAPDALDAGWSEFLVKSSVGAGTHNSGYVSDPTKFTVSASTRYVKIMVYNDGTLGNQYYIELKGIKLYGGM